MKMKSIELSLDEDEVYWIEFRWIVGEGISVAQTHTCIVLELQRLELTSPII